MSSQKYAKLEKIEKAVETEKKGEYTTEISHEWKCKILKDDCDILSLSNNKPMCDRCPVAKTYKADIKRGKRVFRDILEKKKEKETNK